MTVNFPPIAPTSRQYDVGEFPTKRFDSISGAGITRLYGSKAFNASLTLEFVLPDVDTALILDCYNQARGDSDVLNLPSEIFNGMSAALKSQIPAHLSWRWGESPKIQSLFPDQSRLRVQLIGTLDA